MAEVRALNQKGITPPVVLASVAERIDLTKGLYVVAFEHGSDKPTLYASGDLTMLALAAIALQDLTTDYLNDRITPE